MDKFFRKLNQLSEEEDLVAAIEAGRQKLGRIKGIAKLDSALKLLKWAERYHSRKLAQEIINDVLELAKESPTEQAALLLGQKAYYHFANFDIPEASHYADLSLKKSRDIGSNKAETKSLIVKGYLHDVKKEHRKTSAWYTMALAKCTKLQRPGLMLDLGTSLSKQGEYSQAWSFIKRAKLEADDLSNEKSLDDIERTRFKQIVVEAYSRLGPVYEGIGDFDAALRAYDKALLLSTENLFANEICKIYSRKTKCFIMLKSFSEAEATLKKAGEVLQETGDIDPRSFLYLDHDWARLFKDSKQYEKALNKYRQIIFKDVTDTQTGIKRLNDFMDNQADIFSEILKGIAECLNANDRITESERINKEEALFSELKQQTGIYNENDRNYNLRIRKNSIRVALKQIFFNEPDVVEYKNIRAEYDPKEGKTTFKIGETEIKRSQRYFLVFKCLVENAGQRVSGKMLDRFFVDQVEAINEDDSGLRTYVARLLKDINLAQFLEPPSKSEGKGWKLKTP
jgi:tetratricopeptide (TPR) repeat protein